MTQPPVTQAIAKLESSLGVTLFDRSRRRVALTAAGEALLPEVRDLLDRAQGLPRRARAAAAGETGRIRLGFVSTIGFAHLPEWVREFRVAHPRISIELIEATSDWQLEALNRNEIDAGLILHARGETPFGFASMGVQREPLVLALPAGSRLTRGRSLASVDTFAEPVVLFPRRIAPTLHDALHDLYQSVGQTLLVAQEAIQMQTIVNLVSAGIGVAWVPESVTQFRRAGVAYRRVDTLQVGPKTHRALTLTFCETTLVWRTGPGRPALASFIAFLEAQVRSGRVTELLP